MTREFNLENGLVLVGIDPGTHTGVAVAYPGFDPVEDSFMVVSQSALVADECDAVREVCRRLRPMVAGFETVVIAIEDFILRQGPDGKSTVKSSKREGLSACRIGAMLYALLTGGLHSFEVVFQQPSEMSALTNKRLVARGLWVPDGKAGRAAVGVTAEHRRDALRHVCVLANKRGIALSEWLGM